MSTQNERLTKYLLAVDSYILHQMTRRTEAERQAFRAKQIQQYDDALERYAEKLKRAIARRGY